MWVRSLPQQQASQPPSCGGKAGYSGGLDMVSASEEGKSPCQFPVPGPTCFRESPGVQRPPPTPTDSICPFPESPQPPSSPSALPAGPWATGPPVPSVQRPHLPVITFVTMQLE